jgi:hypothetical protein
MFISRGITTPIDRVVLRMSNLKTFATQKTPRMKWTDAKSADDTLMSSLPLAIENRPTQCETKTQIVELAVVRVTVDAAALAIARAVRAVARAGRAVDLHHDARAARNDDDRDHRATNDAAKRPSATSRPHRDPRANDLDRAIRNVTTDGKNRDRRLENRLLADLVPAKHQLWTFVLRRDVLII